MNRSTAMTFCCCCWLVTSIAMLRCFSVSVGPVHNDSTVSVVGFEGQSKSFTVSWGEWPQSWQCSRAVRTTFFIYWPTIRLWPVRSCATIVPVLLGSVCSAVAICGGRPLGCFYELLSMTVLTTSWWMLLMVHLYLVLLSHSSATYCGMLGLHPPIRDRRRSGRSSGDLWQSWW